MPTRTEGDKTATSFFPARFASKISSKRDLGYRALNAHEITHYPHPIQSEFINLTRSVSEVMSSIPLDGATMGGYLGFEFLRTKSYILSLQASAHA